MIKKQCIKPDDTIESERF